MQPRRCTRRINQQLSRIAKSRLALSTVVTTLIVLVISVLLAGVVTYFAINVTSTRVQEESLDLAKQHVWFDFASSKTQAAIMIINSGGRDVVIEKLTVRGQQCDWSKVFFNQTAASVSGDLSYASSLSDGTSMSIGGASFVFKQASSAITLQSGKTLLIYLNNPDSISVNDIGLTVSVNIFTSQAMYYKETNVQGTSGTQTASVTLTMLTVAAYYNSSESTAKNQIGFVLYNGGNTVETITPALGEGNEFRINGTSSVSPLVAGYVGTIQNPPSNLPNWCGQEVSGYTFGLFAEVVIQPGQTAIVYLITGGEFNAGDTIIASIDLDGGGSVSQTVTVQGVS